MKRVFFATLFATTLAAHAADGTRTWAFDAFLDGKPIGHHTFTVGTEGDARHVTSEADFSVRIIGITAYHYHHHAEEKWAGDCLASLVASTDDDGKPASVRLVKEGDANEITTNTGTQSEPGCLMSFAYWNPAMRARKRLLNPQTGKVDSVKIERVGSGHVAVGGKDVAATDWRITGGESPIDLWISAQGEWVGLDSMVSNGRRKLSYRLP